MTTWQPKAVERLARIMCSVAGLDPDERPNGGLAQWHQYELPAEHGLRRALPLIEVTMDMEKAGKDATRWAMTSTQLADACGAMLRACASEGKDQ
jgi:hypothetical protein